LKYRHSAGKWCVSAIYGSMLQARAAGGAGGSLRGGSRLLAEGKSSARSPPRRGDSWAAAGEAHVICNIRSRHASRGGRQKRHSRAAAGMRVASQQVGRRAASARACRQRQARSRQAGRVVAAAGSRQQNQQNQRKRRSRRRQAGRSGDPTGRRPSSEAARQAGGRQVPRQAGGGRWWWW